MSTEEEIPYAYTFEVYTQRDGDTQTTAHSVQAKHSEKIAPLALQPAPEPIQMPPHLDAVVLRPAPSASHDPGATGTHHRHRFQHVQMLLEEQKDCFAYFNPTSKAVLQTTKALWTEALLHSVEFLHQNPKFAAKGKAQNETSV